MNSHLASLRGRTLWERARADALALADTVVRHWVPAGTRQSRIEHALARRMHPAPHRISPVLEAFARLRPRSFFVQVGANDDPDRQPLRQLILERRWRGIVAEPMPLAFDALRRTYGDLPEVALENVAIGPEDGERPFFALGSPESAVVGSLRREPLLFRRRELGDPILETSVHCLTFDSLCRRHRVVALDVLHVDTEGNDLAILEQVDFDRLSPALVVYDNFDLPAEARSACAELMRRAGYETIEHHRDTWCLRPSALAPSEAEVLLPLWRWIADTDDPALALRPTRWVRAAANRVRGATATEQFALTDAERRYLSNGYDDRTALPPGADAYLTDENPRLVALRRTYQALALPAVAHHMWRPTRVSDGVDLRYFRGDNLYQWHYPEHPRAMALSLFVYMRYLEERGGTELLERLSEDGGFGCWTTDIPGTGRVSRDLLDSVNEILFLDRQLGLLSHPGLRVLDIGAGYGRLAHRMAAALPSMIDYCCVDAVPESTFLSEYYLSFRGCSPPTRVVPLDEVPTGLAPGSFDLAVNVHSFSECTLAAIEWWVGQLHRLRVPHLFVVPNEADGLLSREVDGSCRDAMPTLAAAGYTPATSERVLADPAVRELVRINDNFYLFEFRADGAGEPAWADARLTAGASE